MIRRLAVATLVAASSVTTGAMPSVGGDGRIRPDTAVARRQGTAGARQESVQELYRRAYTAFEARKYQDAIKLYDRILAIRPGDSYSLFFKANALVFTGRKAEAAACVKQAIDAGFSDLARLTVEPGMLALRGEPAFDAILRDFDAVVNEDRAPALENIKRVLAEPRFHRFLPQMLPRYRSREVTGDTLVLLESGDRPLERTAIVSLLHQNADDRATRARIASRLGSSSAEIREAAAEYFVWHGITDDRAVLAGAAAKEQDPFVLAAERGALDLIAARTGWEAMTNPPAAEQRFPPGTSCREAMTRLRANPTRDVLRQVAELYRTAWDAEPKLRYSGMRVDGEALEQHRDQFNMTAAVFGFLKRPPGGNASRDEDVPVASTFVAPIRDYFDPGRKSFGGYTGKSGPFRGSFHAGEDVGWNRDDGTVVAIADGIVRRVDYIYSWGFIVIVEHRLPRQEGAYCSLYAHLAPSISVGQGQVVRKGQRIAALGRTATWENGGYPAHLHFGIHRGPYLQSKSSGAPIWSEDPDRPSEMPVRPDSLWITGYVSPERWAEGKQGWVNPQEFIRARLAGQ